MKNKIILGLSFGILLILGIISGPCKGSNDNRVFTPTWITKNDLFITKIIEEGFYGVDSEDIIIAPKSYYKNMPYGNILAVIVPTDAELIGHQKYSRWNTNNLYSADQYFDLSLLPGLPIDYTTINPNMCGFFVISSLLGIDPAYFIVDSWYSYPWIQEHILDLDNGISRDEMIPIFEDHAWSVVHPENIFSDIECNESFAQANEFDVVGRTYLCNFKEMLVNDFSPILIADLSKKHGVLVAEKFFSDQPIGVSEHWVVVLQIISSKDGFTYVRIFNPFNNREEIYTWNDFLCSWAGVDQTYKDIFFVRPNYTKEN